MTDEDFSGHFSSERPSTWIALAMVVYAWTDVRDRRSDRNWWEAQGNRAEPVRPSPDRHESVHARLVESGGVERATARREEASFDRASAPNPVAVYTPPH